MGGPGSFLWLLGHEMRLGWRGGFMFRSGKRPKAGLVITLIFVLVVGGFGGVPLGLMLRGYDLMDYPAFAPIADLALAGIFSLMLSQTLIGAVSILYERGDFDLLLSSPVAPGRVLAVRALAMAFNAVTIFAVLLSPLLLPIAVIGHPSWLVAYGVLAALALTASALGLAMALGLFRLIGPRRTKMVGQILGALIGAAFFLITQARLLLGEERANSFTQDVIQAAMANQLRLPEWATWPARALLGEPVPSAVFVGGALLIFLLVVTGLGRRFADDAAAATGADSPRVRRPGRPPGSFRSGAFRATVTKELRLIFRDPGLISQVLLRVLYMVPLVALILRGAGDHQGMAVASAAGGLAFMSGQVAGSLSWITVSAEDAPELIAGSPARLWTVWRAKVTAALIPLAILLAVPVGALVWMSPLAGVVAAMGCAASSVSTALINIWMQKPGKRQDFRRRRDAALVATIAELIVGMLWGLAVGLAVLRLPWAVIPAALAVLATLVLRRSDEAVMRRLSEAKA